MKSLKYFLFLILFSNVLYAQDTTDVIATKISLVLENYFDLEREAIHLHLNKTDFLTNENIWFKGYIINRKTNALYFSTNIFVALYDENGKKISDQLVFGNNGFFQGNIPIDKKTKSGRYYIQIYTNWMNNFSEDESTVRKINIINPNEGYKNYKKINLETLSIKINPEGGKFIKDVTNTIGIEVSDCNENSIENLEGKVITDNGEVIKSFKLNKFGFGKITLPPSNKKLKIIVITANGEIEKQMPDTIDIGFGLDVNSFSLENKTVINIQTNRSTLQNYSSKKIYLVINQDEKHIIQPILFNNQDKITLSFENKDLFDGINTIRIIDENLNQLTERLFYCNKNSKTEINLKAMNSKGTTIKLNGNSNTIETNISVSTLPKNTLSNNERVPIIAGLRVNPYLENPLKNANYYFENSNRLKYYELDMVLLNQQSLKYDWAKMKINTPKTNYSFDVGLSFKGTIDQSIKEKTAHKVKILSYIDFITKLADVSEKGDYLLEHLAIADSSYVDLSLYKLPNFDKIISTLKPQILNRNKPFYKPLKITFSTNCKDESETVAFEFPKFNKDIINLEEIIIENKSTKPMLKFGSDFGNANLRGFKIDDKNSYLTILQFIEQNGFVVTRNLGQVTITTKFSSASTLRASTPIPQILIDKKEVLFQEELDMIQMNEVDEIYLNAYAFVPGFNNKQGIIKIYLKKSFTEKEKTKNGFGFSIEKGFKRPNQYIIPDYISTMSSGFENFGAIDWNPNLFVNSIGEFEYLIKNFEIENTTVIIEGITNDGQIICQEKSVIIK